MKQKVLLSATLFILISLTNKAQSIDSTNLSNLLQNEKYTAIKLEKYPTGHLWAEIKVNGIKGRFILDTGAGATVAESERKNKFKLKVEDDTLKAVGAGGSNLTVQSSEHNRIEVGKGYKIEDYTLKLISLDKINLALKRLQQTEVDGVLGADVLTQGTAIIDYKNQILYLKQ